MSGYILVKIFHEETMSLRQGETVKASMSQAKSYQREEIQGGVNQFGMLHECQTEYRGDGVRGVQKLKFLFRLDVRHKEYQMAYQKFGLDTDDGAKHRFGAGPQFKLKLL